MSFIVHSTVRHFPKLPYQKMKDEILGKEYQLSLQFVGDTKSRRLNKTYRNKSYVPNVLSFPLEKNIGEIYINPNRAQIEAKSHDMTKSGFIGFLFIHGLLHLKGHRHGDTMEEVEARLKKRYHLT